MIFLPLLTTDIHADGVKWRVDVRLYDRSEVSQYYPERRARRRHVPEKHKNHKDKQKFKHQKLLFQLNLVPQKQFFDLKNIPLVASSRLVYSRLR